MEENNSLAQPEQIIEEQPEVGFLKKLKIHKFKILGGILGVLVFAGVFYAGMFYEARWIATQKPLVGFPTPTPEAVATPILDPTANWKTYTNSEHSFSIKYPKDWEVDEKQVSFTNIVATFTKSGEQFQLDAFYGVEIDIRDNPQNLDVREWAEVEAELVGSKVESLSFKEVAVAGKETFVVAGELPRWTQEVVYLPYKGRIYIIRSTNNLSAESIRQNLKGTFNLMLSTFKFLE